jgi:hypothetical protein
MVMMEHTLLRLRGNEDWDAWGDKWYAYVDVVTNLDFVTGWTGPPDWLRDRAHRYLDWGACMYEVTLVEVRRLIGQRPNYAHIREEWDRPFREAEERQSALLASLPEDGRYAVVWVEVPFFMSSGGGKHTDAEVRTEHGDVRIGGGTCPFCRTPGSYPADSDSWYCENCRREYPTFAYKCAHPDCWEFVFGRDYCDIHKPQTETK